LLDAPSVSSVTPADLLLVASGLIAGWAMLDFVGFARWTAGPPAAKDAGEPGVTTRRVLGNTLRRKVAGRSGAASERSLHERSGRADRPVAAAVKASELGPPPDRSSETFAICGLAMVGVKPLGDCKRPSRAARPVAMDSGNRRAMADERQVAHSDNMP